MFGYKMTDYDKKVYEEELFDFLPDKIVDSHTHVSEKGQDVNNFRDYWVNKVAEEWPLDDLEQTYADLFKGKKVIPVIFVFAPETQNILNCVVTIAVNCRKNGRIFFHSI